MNPLVALGICFGPLVLVVSFLFTAATGPGVPPWADSVGLTIRLWGTGLAVLVGPTAVHFDRVALARKSEWTPSPLYYLIGLPFVSLPIALVYLSRRVMSS